jgi:hypothetical protein
MEKGEWGTILGGIGSGSFLSCRLGGACGLGSQCLFFVASSCSGHNDLMYSISGCFSVPRLESVYRWLRQIGAGCWYVFFLRLRWVSCLFPRSEDERELGFALAIIFALKV